MTILLALMLAQDVSLNVRVSKESEPIQAHQGQVVVLRPGPEYCGPSMTIFGDDYHCRPDGTLIIGVDSAQPPGLYRLVNLFGVTVANVIVQSVAWHEESVPGVYTHLPVGDMLKTEQPLKDAAYTFDRDPHYAERHFRVPTWHVVDDDPPVHTRFGTRRVDPDCRVHEIHTGIDFAVPVGSSVYSMAAGYVVFAGPLPVEGTTVIIHHGDGIYSVYCHLSQLAVSQGNEVSGGARIAWSGATPLGRGLSPHLHWTVRVRRAYVDPVPTATRLNNELPR